VCRHLWPYPQGHDNSRSNLGNWILLGLHADDASVLNTEKIVGSGQRRGAQCYTIDHGWPSPPQSAAVALIVMLPIVQLNRLADEHKSSHEHSDAEPTSIRWQDGLNIRQTHAYVQSQPAKVNRCGAGGQSTRDVAAEQ
jgi:hypothetical protein